MIKTIILPDEDLKLRHTGTELFLISVLVLFLELLLIRWISTEINIFAYLQNTVLVVCFLGLGMGCLSSKKPCVLRNSLIPLLLLLLLMSIPMTKQFLRKISFLLATTGDLLVWDLPRINTTVEPVFFVTFGLACTFGLMFLVWQMFIPIGRVLGRLIDDHPKPIQAYSINIAGSLIGIWLFGLLSALYQPPAVWFLFVGALFSFFAVRAQVNRRFNSILVLAIVPFVWFLDRDDAAIKVVWSPYQKFVVTKPNLPSAPLAKYFVSVNNSWFQDMIDLRPETIRSYGSGLPPHPQGVSQYDIPFLLHKNPQKVLIVGSGSGNDVAGALRHSVQEITAVEIDSAIIKLGRRYHPEQPYSSPAVKIVSDDARSFFGTSRERFDVICFGLLDSHTTTAMTNARLDHYVYTKESIEMARSLLADGGIMVLTFYATKPFVSDRIAKTLRDVFGEEPIFFRIPKSAYGVGGAMFLAGNLDGAREQITGNGKLVTAIELWKREKPLNPDYILEPDYTTEVTTDDWPYLYLDSRRIPLLYYLLALMLLGLFIYTRWQFKFQDVTRNWEVSHWHFFFLGAAFLLLQVQNVSKASVVLGNTWQVNAIIISGILIMILIANLIASLFPRISLRLIYTGLIGSSLGLYFVDLARFAALSYGQKVVITALLTALPVLFSGIIFIHSFANVTKRDKALGANMIGALVGGVLQSVTFITGIKALLVVVAGLYVAAMLCSPNSVTGTVGNPPER